MIVVIEICIFLHVFIGMNNKTSVMKKVTFILAALAIAVTSFGNKKVAENMTNRTDNKVISLVPDEKSQGEIIHLTKKEFIAKIWDYNVSPKEWKYKGNKPAIIDFYADWCGPCRIAAPILEEISKEYAGKIIVYKIDTDKEKELAADFGIQSIPAFLYIPVTGKPILAAGVGRSKEETKSMFVENINKHLLTEK